MVCNRCHSKFLTMMPIPLEQTHAPVYYRLRPCICLEEPPIVEYCVHRGDCQMKYLSMTEQAQPVTATGGSAQLYSK